MQKYEIIYWWKMLKVKKVNYENKNYGTILTPNTLIAARANGSLFIRKCILNSGIELYSDFLLQYLTFFNFDLL